MEFGKPYLKNWEIGVKCEVSLRGKSHRMSFIRDWEGHEKIEDSCYVIVPLKSGFTVGFSHIDEHTAIGLNSGIGPDLTEEEKAMLTPIVRRGVEMLRDAEVIIRQNNK